MPRTILRRGRTVTGHRADRFAKGFPCSWCIAHARMGASSRPSPAMNQKILNDINERLREVFAHSPAADLEKNLRALLASVFARLDLVTREEFDVQRQVLLRTREKLARLEAQVAELERARSSRSLR